MHDVTVNDVCLAAVTGALRALALSCGEPVRPLKAMVPVSVRTDDERTALGNRISFAFVELPLELGRAESRLQRVHEQTAAFKSSDRPAGFESLMGALGYLPNALKTPAARLVGSKRVYNLTVSNIPGPRFPVYMAGAVLREAYPVVPLAEGHTLSIGMFSYRDWMFFGLYADPEALPEVRRLPGALERALWELRGHRPHGVRRRRFARRSAAAYATSPPSAETSQFRSRVGVGGLRRTVLGRERRGGDGRSDGSRQEELEEMSRPTMDRAIEAIERGDVEAAKALCEEMKHEWRLLHDLMAGGMAGLISFVQERLGDEGVEEAWEYSLERGWKSHARGDRSSRTAAGWCTRSPRTGAPTRAAARARIPARSRSPRTTRSSRSR